MPSPDTGVAHAHGEHLSNPFADIEVSTDLSMRLNGMALLVEYLARGRAKDPAEVVRLLDAIIDGADAAIDLLPPADP